jgi:two-component system invasion response regulator UvrY
MDVLLVDDDERSRRTFRRLIHANSSFKVVAEAPNGESALELLKTVRPDVVVTGVDLPTMTGAALTEEVKRLYPYVHVLALADADEATKTRMRDAGASGFIATDNSEQLTLALDLTADVGPDRRRGDRPRVIAGAWD